MEFIVLIIALIILFNIILLNSFNSQLAIPKGPHTYNSFSILIAAKNEEKNIPALIKSLSNIDYPKEYFEVIIVDDNSSDETFSLLKDKCREIDNIKIIKAENKELPGKKGALSIGIEYAKNDFIVTTDADCIVPVNWLKYLDLYAGNNKSIVIGNVLFRNVATFSQKYFDFELLRNRFLSFALAKLGLPYTAAGGNFCYPKELLRNIGGYEKISQTLSGDDDLLLQKGKALGCNITVMDNLEATVYTDPPSDLKSYLIQKQRHLSASNYYSFLDKSILTLWHSVNLLALLSIFFSAFYGGFIIVFLTKITFDLITITFTSKRYKKRFGLMETMLFQLLYECFLPVNYLRASFGKIKWKE